ncbi:MAG: cytochrome b N-terminal domain-containing protein [Peptococcaceae bacterium]|nr:cytochrome b N-terminal domain-containing protein [Peptococcaceae bacterium]
MTQKRTQENFLWHIRARQVPARALSVVYTFCLGGISFLAFVVLAVTGVLLMFHYQPGYSDGYHSVLNLASVIPYGAVLRNLHYWAGQIMVITVALHMVRVVWTQSYRPPRELNWVVGVSLLVITIILDFSGYLLRGSQESGAAATVAVHILQLVPGIGVGLAAAFFGHPTALSGSTLMIYVWHCVALPSVAFYLQGYHFWRVRKDGGIKPL